MIVVERTFPFSAAEVEVTFDWDSGDPSVGIGSGWGENTCAIVKAGPLRIVFVFVPDDDKPVSAWAVEEVQVLYEHEHDREAIRDRAVQTVDRHHRYTMEFAPSPEQHREEYDRVEETLLARPKPLKDLAISTDAFLLSEAPEVCIAVQHAWEEVLFLRRLESLVEDCWGAEGYISELEEQLNPDLFTPPSPEARARIEAAVAEQRARCDALKAERTRLQAEYAERYGEPQA